MKGAKVGVAVVVVVALPGKFQPRFRFLPFNIAASVPSRVCVCVCISVCVCECLVVALVMDGAWRN